MSVIYKRKQPSNAKTKTIKTAELETKTITLKKFWLHYTFIGQGSCFIMAKNADQAIENFYQGDDWLDDEQETNQYEIDQIKQSN